MKTKTMIKWYCLVHLLIVAGMCLGIIYHSKHFDFATSEKVDDSIDCTSTTNDPYHVFGWFMLGNEFVWDNWKLLKDKLNVSISGDKK